MARLLPTLDNPYQPEGLTRHAGKVFVLTQGVLSAVDATSSEGQDRSVLSDRFLLCLWDLDDGTSIWIALRSEGDFEVPHASKRLYAGVDPNWMDEEKQSRYSDRSIWRLGRLGQPVRFSQAQQRAITVEELERVRGRISQISVDALVSIETESAGA